MRSLVLRLGLVSLILPVIFCSFISCSSTPVITETPTVKQPVTTPDLKALEQKVKVESDNYRKLLDEFKAYVSNIKDPCNIELSKIFPDDWLFEIYYNEKGARYQKWALAMPISSSYRRGLEYQSTKDGLSYYQGNKLDPNTNQYIVPTWNGQTYDWTDWNFDDEEMYNFPKPVSHDYFPLFKLCSSPYMIPYEATHGVYTGSCNSTNCNVGGLQKIIDDIIETNPYDETGSVEQNTVKALNSLNLMLDENLKIEADIKSYLSLVDLLDKTYFTPNSIIYDKRNELEQYKNELTKINKELKETYKYMKRILDWSFNSLTQYRAVTKK